MRIICYMVSKLDKNSALQVLRLIENELYCGRVFLEEDFLNELSKFAEKIFGRLLQSEFPLKFPETTIILQKKNISEVRPMLGAESNDKTFYEVQNIDRAKKVEKAGVIHLFKLSL